MVIFSCQEPISRGKSIFALIRIFYETKEVDILVTPGLGDISINQFSQSVVLLLCVSASTQGGYFMALDLTRRGGSRFIVTRAE